MALQTLEDFLDGVMLQRLRDHPAIGPHDAVHNIVESDDPGDASSIGEGFDDSRGVSTMPSAHLPPSLSVIKKCLPFLGLILTI